MRSFADLERAIGSVPSSVVARPHLVDAGHGREGLYRNQLPGLFTHLRYRARAESVTASSAL